MDSEPISLINALLPAPIQRKTGVLPSLRDVLSKFGTAVEARSRASSDGSITPPPTYGAALAAREDDLVLSRSSSRSSSPDGALSGIRSKHADRGNDFMSLCASHKSAHPDVIRHLYVEGLSCYLRGLPESLTEDETFQLRDSLPADLVPEQVQDEIAARHPRPSSTARPPLLQRAVTLLTVYACVVLAFLIPYVQHLMQRAYELDRQYRLSDQVLARGVAGLREVSAGVYQGLEQGCDRAAMSAVVAETEANTNAVATSSEEEAEAVRCVSADKSRQPRQLNARRRLSSATSR